MMEPKEETQDTIYTPAQTPNYLSPRRLKSPIAVLDYNDTLLVTLSRENTLKTP